MDEQFLDLGFVDQSFLEGFEDTIQRPEQENQQTTTEEEINNNESSEETKQLEESNKETKEVKEPESNKEVEENPEVNQEQGSPNNISSSIAEALVDEGVLQTLSKERLAEIKDAESLIAAYREDMDNQVESRLDDITKRVHHALTYGVEPTKIQQYEQWIKTLDSVTEDILEGEEEQNENYRKNLIYRNYIAKGFDEEEALEMTNRSIESGKDVDDAKKALSSLRKYYQKAYNDEINEAKRDYEKHVASQKKQLEDLKTSILEDKENFYEQFEIGKTARQKILDVVAKPSVTDGDKKITPLQKFIKDDPNKANKIIGTLYVLTDGFTKFDGIYKGAVKKEVRKSVENLERVLKQSQPADGSMKYMSGVTDNTDDFKILDFAI